MARMAADVRVVPNRGRDIGPLITEFGGQLLADCDIVGHIHTKKTAENNDPEMGRVWREFLLDNLVGGREPMAMRIVRRMEADRDLGLVFPDDPHVWGWTDNKRIAAAVAADLGISDLPDKHFWFPIGTMFWARVQAIAPLLKLPWDWDDYPDEPLAADGTSLHAIERLLPVVAKEAGYRIALTNVPGVTR
jgi:lipopolysaccharide biosynthesis protein